MRANVCWQIHLIVGVFAKRIQNNEGREGFQQSGAATRETSAILKAHPKKLAELFVF